jgi:hypothetical protein
MSTRSPGLKYTAQGLGDRIHLISLCYEISKSRSEMVTLHLAKNHLGGKKRDSFLEILSLFPNSLIELRFHESEFQTTSEWKSYLTREGIMALSFGYPDHPGWLEKPSDIDASLFLHKRHLLQPSCKHRLELPTEFVTVQWDSTGKDRQLPEYEISNIEKKYLESGLAVIPLGGQSTDELLRDCLNCSASAVYQSKYFAGVDSGFLHLALQIKNPSEIHLYTARNRYWSHHTFRAIEMGSVLNYYSKKINSIDFIYAKLRYDSPKLISKLHKFRQIAGIERYETHD